MNDKELKILEVGDMLQKAITEFFVPLQTIRVINERAFEEIDRATRELARLLKGSEQVPKSLLREIYAAIGILANEARQSKEHAPVLEEMANRIDVTFGLILSNESHDDRIPGVPRII